MKEFEDRVSSLMWGSRTSNAGPPPRKTILAISGGKGGGHKAPMAGVLGKLARDTQVNVHSKVDFDVGNFVDPNRGLLDDALYKASNNAPGTAVATRWRKENSQKATYQAVSNWLALPQHQGGTLLYTNHRIRATRRPTWPRPPRPSSSRPPTPGRSTRAGIPSG
jgi:hypothetical protein